MGWAANKADFVADQSGFIKPGKLIQRHADVK